MTIHFEPAFLVTFLCSSMGCAALLLFKDRFSVRRRHDVSAVQAAHDTPTPRTGGLALWTALLCTCFFVPAALRPTFVILVLTSLPVFLAGLMEDLGFAMRPKWRLCAAALSSALSVAILGVWVARVDVPGVDQFLGLAPIAMCFTIFATVGVCNAFNLIDGMNGLSAGTGAVTSIGLAVVANLAGQSELVPICFLALAALMGFLVFNYPWGRIFLGDAGAYVLGHFLAWVAVMLMFCAPDVTPWAVVLIFFWPLADTVFAMFRRYCSGQPSSQPDGAHFHQLVMRYMETRYMTRDMRHVSNPLTTLILLPFVSAPVLAGVLLWQNPFWAFVCWIVFSVLFVRTYRCLDGALEKLSRTDDQYRFKNRVNGVREQA